MGLGGAVGCNFGFRARRDSGPGECNFGISGARHSGMRTCDFGLSRAAECRIGACHFWHWRTVPFSNGGAQFWDFRAARFRNRCLPFSALVRCTIREGMRAILGFQHGAIPECVPAPSGFAAVQHLLGDGVGERNLQRWVPREQGSFGRGLRAPGGSRDGIPGAHVALATYKCPFAFGCGTSRPPACLR